MKSKTTKGVVLIFGGCGYVGFCIAAQLYDQGFSILLADIQAPPERVHVKRFNFTFSECDITNEKSIEALFEKVQEPVLACIHLASVGMSGSSMLDERTETINVGGTKNVIDACKRHNIKALLYASSYNVAFGGNEIVMGDSTTPDFPYEGHSDYYSRSKAVAESMVLRANDENGLATIALRPAAIYGEGETRHFPRIVANMDSGVFVFRIGRATVDWIHGENLAQAFVKALQNLTTTASAAGRAYPVSDGTPVHSFLFFEPLCRARRAPFPTVVLPVWLAAGVAYLLEKGHILMRSIVGADAAPAPFLTRAEVYKVGVTHTFSVHEAVTDFGYKPTISSQQGAERMGKAYELHQGHEHLVENENFYRLPPFVESTAVVAAMIWVCYVGFHESPCNYSSDKIESVACSSMESLVLTVFRSKFFTKAAFLAAVAAHAIEGAMAVSMARKLGVRWSRCVLWFIQVIIIGFPSWTSLQERHEFVFSKKKQ